ncbi:MAG: hypothetical protein P1S60_01015 [Anaerolineae bacterium]|nr:hypothetical protein [Anaerolineae bacterium]
MFKSTTAFSIVDACPASGPAAYGKARFLAVLKNRGCRFDIVKDINQSDRESRIIIGLTDNAFIRSVLNLGSSAPEGVIIRHSHSQNMLVIAGTDERGLMYALLELAQQVEAEGASGLDTIEDIMEFPANRVRGVDRYLMGHLDNEWFFSDAFWHYFLSQMAENRFNRFVLILGFDTAYLTPPYPSLVEVPGFHQVRAVSDEERQKNLDQLRDIGKLCHQYGLEFFLGTWQQTPWTEVQRVLVENLPSDEGALAEYCARGMTAVLNACDSIDGVQLRVNFEAGVGSQVSNDAFWMRIVDAVAAASRPVALAIRAKGMSNNLLAYARQSGLQFEVPTKHWCEHTGLPYHLTRMRTEEINNLANLNHSRRYSYADLLHKPQKCDIVYRLWNYGSTCLFTWGDPDHARRFSHSCQMGGSGFEIDAALSLKYGQQRLQRAPWSVFADPSLQSTGWEDERHWLRYMVYGRLGYSPYTSARVWQRELEKRFGQSAATFIERAHAAAGKVMPLLTAAHMPVHPSQIYWPEMSTGAALFAEHNFNTRYGQVTYGSTEPSDPGLFYGIEEYVTDVNAGKLKRKYTPLQVAGWLKQLANDIHNCLSTLHLIQDLHENLEYRQAVVDLKMVAGFAQFHAWKISAAYHLAQYGGDSDAAHLQQAFACMSAAAVKWDDLVETGAVFQMNLEFGVGAPTDRHGHWRDRKGEIEKDLVLLKKMLNNLPGGSLDEMQMARVKKREDMEVPACWVQVPAFTAEWPVSCPAGKGLELIVSGPLCDSVPRLHYRHTNQLEGEFQTAEMELCEKGYRGVIPGVYIDPAWDLLIYVTQISDNQTVTVFPGIYHPEYPAPYHHIRVL